MRDHGPPSGTPITFKPARVKGPKPGALVIDEYGSTFTRKNGQNYRDGEPFGELPWDGMLDRMLEIIPEPEPEPVVLTGVEEFDRLYAPEGTTMMVYDCETERMIAVSSSLFEDARNVTFKSTPPECLRNSIANAGVRVRRCGP